MRIYNGAVLFVDILGVGALTKSKSDSVVSEDFAAFGRLRSSDLRNQVFCAVLLSEFRKNLRATNTEKLRLAQLSDCAFVWSDNVDAVVEFARSLFWRNLQSGLLCRGGLAYGEIVEPDKIGRGIGDFVCGEAVTRAVELERSGKGSRIFIDRDIGGQRFKNTPPDAFRPVSSPIDFKTIDEYVWFALPATGPVIQGVPSKHLLHVMDAAIQLRYAPHFRWNAASAEGRIHVAATIELMQNFASTFCVEKRLPFPSFSFVTAEMYMEMGNLTHSAERTPQAYDSVRKLAATYKKKNFPKKKLKIGLKSQKGQR